MSDHPDDPTRRDRRPPQARAALPDRPRPHRRPAAARPRADRRPDRADRRLLRAGARRTGVRRQHQDARPASTASTATTASASASIRKRRSSSAGRRTASRSSRAPCASSVSATRSTPAPPTRATRSCRTGAVSELAASDERVAPRGTSGSIQRSRTTSGGSRCREPSAAWRRRTTSRPTWCGCAAPAWSTHVEPVDGELTLTDSPWDPYTELLPIRGPVTAELVTARHTAREITLAGPLDADAFWPHVDTIGGSRWPGDRGGPRVRP